MERNDGNRSSVRRERDIAEALKQNDEVCHPVGETLPEEQRVYQVRVLKTFLCAAVPPIFSERYLKRMHFICLIGDI